MFDAEIQRKIEDFRELGMPEFVTRSGKIHIVKLMLSTLIGSRRSGKSFMALQYAAELLQSGELASIRQICHMDFDNPILATMKAPDLLLIQKVFLKCTPELNLKSKIIFVLDEIHRITGWEDYVIDLSRNPNWQVIVTGSSSKMLHSDLATSLRGKTISTMVYPLSFLEFLNFKGEDYNSLSTVAQAKLRASFDEYLRWGAYPAIPSTPIGSRAVLLREYFETMIFKDIIQRHNPSKPEQCIALYRYMLSNIARPITLKSAYEFLVQAGNAASRDSTRNYIAWAEDAWLFFNVPVFSDSQKEQERNYRKIYCIDWGLALNNSSVWDGSYSHALENLVFMALKRQHSRVCYYRTRKTGQEVDFLVSDGGGKVEIAVQVCQNISHPDTLNRELTPLVATANYFGCREALILTLDEEKVIDKEGLSIQVLPVWKWLLRLNGSP